MFVPVVVVFSMNCIIVRTILYILGCYWQISAESACFTQLFSKQFLVSVRTVPMSCIERDIPQNSVYYVQKGDRRDSTAEPGHKNTRFLRGSLFRRRTRKDHSDDRQDSLRAFTKTGQDVQAAWFGRYFQIRFPDNQANGKISWIDCASYNSDRRQGIC